MPVCCVLIQPAVALGKTEYMRALTFDCGTRYFMSCRFVPVAAARIKNGVVGTATSPCTVR